MAMLLPKAQETRNRATGIKAPLSLCLRSRSKLVIENAAVTRRIVHGKSHRIRIIMNRGGKYVTTLEKKYTYGLTVVPRAIEA
jgi:hypothetical protein